MRSFKCEDKGVYNEVNDRSTNREERAQDAPLSSVLVEVRGFEPLFLRVTEQLSTYLACCRLSFPQSQQANFTSTEPLFPSEVRGVTSCGSLLNHAG